MKGFAANEVAAKALDTVIGRGVSFQDIEISNYTNGSTLVNFTGVAAERLAILGGYSWSYKNSP